MLRRLFRVGIHRDDREIVVDAPHRVLEEQPRADRQHHVGLAPQLVAERQRHGERIAAIEHALAAAEAAQHRRLQHLGQRGDLGRSILRAAADHDQRIFRRAEALGGIAQRVLVDRGLLDRQRVARRRPRRGLPQTLIGHSSAAGPGRPVTIARNASATMRGAASALGDQRRMIDQPRDDAGLIVDLVQLAKLAADVAIGNLPDQRQHRRIHRIGGEQRGDGIEQARPRAPPRRPAACRSRARRRAPCRRRPVRGACGPCGCGRTP